VSLLPGAPRALHQQPLVPHSWYWEPVDCIERLFEEVTFTGPIHDPCCGAGRIPITTQKFGYEATGSDLIDRGYGVFWVDFFTDWTPRQTIVCNPPSDKKSRPVPTLRDRIVLHAIEVAMIAPVPYLCGQWRRDHLYRPHPPRLIPGVWRSAVDAAGRDPTSKPKAEPPITAGSSGSAALPARPAGPDPGIRRKPRK
jgi:hypothetical protein